MGRELKRKEAKRNRKNVKEIKEEQELNTGVEKISLIKIGIVVISLFILLYLILAIFVTKELDLTRDKDEETQETEPSSVSNAILASSTFSQSDETYYVFFYGFEDKDVANLASSVTSDITDYPVYKVDTDSGLNKNYVSDISNSNVTSIENLKVKSPTLIQISADKVTKYIEGTDKIEAYLEK